jgi:hypothetical protein
VKDVYCNCEDSKGVYVVDEMWGYWYHCSDCNKRIEMEFHYYSEEEEA